VHIPNIPRGGHSYVPEYQEYPSYEGLSGYMPRVRRVLTVLITGRRNPNSETGVAERDTSCAQRLSVAGFCAIPHCSPHTQGGDYSPLCSHPLPHTQGGGCSPLFSFSPHTQGRDCSPLSSSSHIPRGYPPERLSHSLHTQGIPT